MIGPEEDRPIKSIKPEEIPDSEEPDIGRKIKVNFWKVRYKKFGPYDAVPREYSEMIIAAPTAEDAIAIMGFRKLKHEGSSGCNGTFEIDDIGYAGTGEMDAI